MVFVKSLDGRTYTIEFPSRASVRQIKNSIEKIEGISADEQRLSFEGNYFLSLLLRVIYGLRTDLALS